MQSPDPNKFIMQYNLIVAQKIIYIAGRFYDMWDMANA